MRTKKKSSLLTLVKYALFGLFIQCFAISPSLAKGDSGMLENVKEVKIVIGHENSSVREAFSIIESNSIFRFAYDKKDVNLKSKLDLSEGEYSVADLLDRISRQTRLSFKQINNTIYVKKEREIRREVDFSAIDAVQKRSNGLSVERIASQTHQVRGKVTSYEDNSGLPGVNVLVRGTTTGTTTDVEGNYTLQVPGGNATLVFSYIGFVSEEIPVNSRSIIDVVLAPDIQQLSEIVVIGYGTVKKSDLTGAVSSVKSDEIKMAPVANVAEALQGRVAGMDIVRTSGRSGSEPLVTVRGNRSLGEFGADNSPLYIIDGIAGNITSLNPFDIESIEVLKDASSTAIYGSAGSNGVVMITTKKAEKGKVIVDFDAFTGVNAFASFPRALQGDAWLQYLEDGYQAAYDKPSVDRNELLTAYSMSPDQLNPYINDGKWIDWVDETLHTGIQQNYNLSIRGGGEKTLGYLSMGYNSEKGIYKNDQTDIITMRAGVTNSFSDWMEAGVQTRFDWRDRDTRSSRVNKTFSAIPLGDVFDEEGNVNPEPIAGHSTVSIIADDVEGVYLNNSKQLRISANPYVQFRPLKGLSFKSIIGANLSASRTGMFENENSFMKLSGSSAQVKTAEYRSALNYNYTWENIVNYNFKVGSDHSFDLTGVTSWKNNQNERSYAYNEGFDYDEFQFLNMKAGNNPSVETGYSHTKMMSYVGRINYGYKGRYLFTLSNRWDGASQLVKQWHSFPAGAFAWRISDEDFMAGTSSWLSNLKFRLGYGVTGTSNIDAYSSLTAVTNSSHSLSLGSSQAPVYVLSESVSNPFLTWEKSYNTNIGLDFGLLNDRIDVAVDWYNTDTKGGLFNRPLPSSLGGFTSKNPYLMTSNIARIRNRGLELTINSRNIDTDNFQWSSDLTFAFNKEQVRDIDLGPGVTDKDLIALNLFLGHPVNTIYGYKKLGIWQLDEADEAALHGRVPGQVRIETVEQFDENGVGDGGEHAYSANDQQVLGSETPDWTLGFNNRFYYKNFDLNVFMTMRWGHLVNADLLGYFKYAQPNIPANYNYWTPENPTNDFPRPNRLGSSNDVALGSLPIVDGSYLKVRNISLGYTIPSNLGKRLGINNLRIYGTISNPFIYAKSNLLKDMDPETNGTDEFPLYKQIVGGINFSF